MTSSVYESRPVRRRRRTKAELDHLDARELDVLQRVEAEERRVLHDLAARHVR